VEEEPRKGSGGILKDASGGSRRGRFVELAGSHPSGYPVHADNARIDDHVVWPHQDAMASKGNSSGRGDLEEDIVELLDQGDSSDLALGTVQGPVSGEDQKKAQGGIDDREVGRDASFSELFRTEKAQIGYVQIDGGEANDAQAVALSAICS